ncbi:MAG: hypothetical protein JRC77_10730, partial [Deltaproteobacteria bacterium]|nr:hypothetical protein [Deltaproteobacteria bacterium]
MVEPSKVIAASGGLIIALSILLASACSCNETQKYDVGQDGDLSEKDASADVRLDTKSSDSGVEQGTSGDSHWCGQNRQREPEIMPTREPFDCGSACKQVTFSNFVELDYQVANDLLVYVGQRGLGYKVYVVDLSSGVERRLFGDQDDINWGCHHATTDGQGLAYTCVLADFPDNPEWSHSISIFDLATNAETDLQCYQLKHTYQACFPSRIAIGAAGIALGGSLGACTDGGVLFHDARDGSFRDISEPYSHAGQPDISGKWIVWTARPPSTSGVNQIMLYDTEKKEIRRIAPTATPQWQARIQGDRVVWTDYRNGGGLMLDPRNTDIFMYDIGTGKTVAVTTHLAEQSHPDVWGDWVVWQDWRNTPGGIANLDDTNCDIYARNMKTGEEVQLTDFPARELSPRVDEGRAFFR